MARRVWSAEELKYLREHVTDTETALAAHLGRSVSSVSNRRRRELQSPNHAPYDLSWSEGDEAYLRAHWDDKIPDLARVLGRTEQAVRGRRSLIRRRDGLPARRCERFQQDDLEFIRRNYESMTRTEIAETLGFTLTKVSRAVWQLGLFSMAKVPRRNPFEVGSRTLLARTCTQCGILKNAEQFLWKPRPDGDGYRTRASACRSCEASRRRTQYRRNPTPQMVTSRSWYSKVQSITVPRAYSKDEPWDQNQDAVIKDTSLPLLIAALRTGRSYASASGRASRLGVKRRKKLVDADKNWVVIFDRIGVERALELEAEGKIDPTGIPTEAEWDWNDEVAG